ncbi:MAG: hypothetical protein ACOYLV_02035 [Rubrivivax sp.]
MKAIKMSLSMIGRMARHSLLFAGGLVVTLSQAAAQAPAADPLSYKLASDLRLAIDAPRPARQAWLREAAGQRWVRVVVTGHRRHADLTETRQDIVQRGGQVVSHDPSLGTVVAVLPAGQVRPLAARAEVMQVTPDRALDTVAKAPPPVAGSTHLAAYGLGPNSARAVSDRALLGE